MKRLAFLAGLVCGAVGLAYCGGASTTDIDAGGDASDDGTTGNDGGTDGAAGDSGNTDGGTTDAGCAQYLTDTCDAGCPTNSVCVTHNVGPSTVGGCFPTSQCGGGQGLCECIGKCACPGPNSQCQQSNNGAMCTGGTVSRREFKTDIAYVDDAERESLASQALETHLTEYRYKSEPEGAQRHLGFLIDDMPDPSPAVQSDRTHVDLYGYTSMLLATVQQQQKQIDDLKKQVDALKKQR